MELNKLRKRSMKIQKERERIQCLALGVIIPNRLKTFNKQIQDKINSNACLSQINEAQIHELNRSDFPEQFVDEQTGKSDNKLFHYFVSKVRERQNFAEAYNEYRSQVSIWTEWMRKIYDSIKLKQQTKVIRLCKIKRKLEKLYKQCHEIYQEFMTVNQKKRHHRVSQHNLEGGMRIKTNWGTEGSQARKKVNWIKQIIEEKEVALEQANDQCLSIQNEKISFLKMLLAKGYHQSDGVYWILEKLAENKVTLTPKDFPSFIDATTASHLLGEYQDISKDKLRKGAFPPLQQQQINSSRSHKSASLLTEFEIVRGQKSIRSIYEGTKDYVKQWLSKQKWKERSLRNYSQSVAVEPEKREWKERELKRIKRIKSKETCEKTLNFVFGIKKYQAEILKGEDLVLKKQVSSRKPSTSLFCSRNTILH